MEQIKDLVTIITLILAPYMAYIHRLIVLLRKDLDMKVSKVELSDEGENVREYVRLVQAPERVLQAKSQEDIKRIEQKLDRVIDMLSRNGK